MSGTSPSSEEPRVHPVSFIAPQTYSIQLCNRYFKNNLHSATTADIFFRKWIFYHGIFKWTLIQDQSDALFGFSTLTRNKSKSSKKSSTISNVDQYLLQGDQKDSVVRLLSKYNIYFIIISILIKLLQVQHYRPKFQGTPEYDPSRSWLQCQRKLWTEEFKFESGEQLSLLLKLSTLFLLFNSVRFNFICDISPVCFYVIKYNPIVPNNSSGIQIISFRALISRTNSCEHFSKSFQTSYLYGRKYFIRKLPSSLTTTTL